MKFYIATRYSDETYRQLAVEMKESLESQGHQMTFDWMNGENVKPYDENPALCNAIAKKALDGATEADFFICIAEPQGTGMYVEFGAAINSYEKTGSPKIFVMGEHKNCSLFSFHPAVQHINTLEEILAFLEK